MGGEKAAGQPLGLVQIGSPPRGRGKVTRLYALADLEGITPAWAGKRLLSGHVFHGEWDHPRVGGEKISAPSFCPGTFGSPPRGRGKAERKETAMMLSRITPAWAGKSVTLQRIKKPPGDHPRVGGEKVSRRWMA